MRFLKKNKRILLILLILLPTAMILSSLITNVRGGPYVPESHADNGWHWDVDVGDHMYFEAEFILTNATTGEVFMMYKDIWIFNITSIENITTNWMGYNQFSQVNATKYYYNVTEDELEAYGPSAEIALFGYNNTDTITHRIRAGQNGNPFLLPINGTNGLEVDVLDDIINESFYYPMSQFGGFNAFDYYESNSTTNRIYFSNSTDGFFYTGYYYDNGTLDTGSAYLRVEMGEGPILVNATMTQVFDYDITDEVQWGVNVGDIIYYDWVENEYTVDDAIEWKMNITDISDILFNKTKNSFSDDLIQMEYQAVFADRYIWNGTDYVFIDNTIIGTANNFYPQYYDEVGGDPIMPFIWPINIPMENTEFMWNNDTLRIWDEMHFDEIYFNENGFIEFRLTNSTGIDRVEIIINKTTGLAQSFLMLNPYGLMYFEMKTQTLVDWSVNIGDVIYYKNNEKPNYNIY